MTLLRIKADIFFAGNTTKLRKSTQFYKNWCSNGVVNQPTCRTELLPVGVNSTRRAICCTAVFAFAWVYTFSVMATLECPMRYCSDLMSMPRFAMLVQKYGGRCGAEMRGRGVSGCSRLYFLTADIKDRLKFRLARIVRNRYHQEFHASDQRTYGSDIPDGLGHAMP